MDGELLVTAMAAALEVPLIPPPGEFPAVGV
jgi:hypothetical protein